MSAQIDYTTIAIIATLSGFGGAIGTEIAKTIIGELRSRSKSISHKPQRLSEEEAKWKGPSPVICGFMIVLGAIFGTLVTKPFPIVAKVLGASLILTLVGAVCIFA